MISFLKTSTHAHIYLSPSLQSVLHVFTVSQWSLFLKLQPALIYIYPVSAICTSRIYSLAVISFLETSTRAHIYLFTFLQSVLHVFTVSQVISFLKTSNTCSYISIPVSAIRTLRIYNLAVISFLKTSTRAHIYINLRLCNPYFTYLQSRSDLFS